MPFSCCVPGCSTNSKDYMLLSFHSLPKNKKCHKEWAELVRNNDLPSVPKVCSLHFDRGVKTYNTRPTIFPYLPSWPEVVLQYNKKVAGWLKPFKKDHTYTKAPRVLQCMPTGASRTKSRTSQGVIPKVNITTQHRYSPKVFPIE